MNDGHGVLVGYDGSESSEAALEWAAAEADVRGTRLTVCHTWQALYSGPAVLPLEALAQAAEEVGRKAAERVGQARPGLEVKVLTICGSAPWALMDEARDADLLVVGSHGHGGVREALLGSVSAQLAAHAPGTVVIVRGLTEPPPESEPGRVVAGVDGSPVTDEVLRVAFEEARLHGLPLTAVCVWPDQAEVRQAPFVDGPALKAFARSRFQQAVDDWQAKFSDVRAHTRFTDGDPGAEILTSARDARLLVVGSRGLGGTRARFLGSVSQTAAHEAPCPVAILHDRT